VAGNVQRTHPAGHGRRHGAARLLVDPHDRVVRDGIELQVGDAEARENGVKPDPRRDSRNREPPLSARGGRANRIGAIDRSTSLRSAERSTSPESFSTSPESVFGFTEIHTRPHACGRAAGRPRQRRRAGAQRGASPLPHALGPPPAAVPAVSRKDLQARYFLHHRPISAYSLEFVKPCVPF